MGQIYRLILIREFEKGIFNIIDTKFGQFKLYIEYGYHYYYLALYQIIPVVAAAISEFGNSINENRKEYCCKGP